MTTPGQDHTGAGQGFAGLASLASDIDLASIAAAPAPATAMPPPVPPQATRKAASASTLTSTSGATVEAAPGTDWAALARNNKWIFVAGAILLWWLYAALSRPPAKPVAPSPAVSAAVQAAAEAARNAQAAAPSPAVRPSSSRPTELKPMPGTDLVLTLEEVRWCQAEKVRLEAGKSVIDNRVGADVSRFNDLVTDFNSRCGAYRYRKPALTTAQADVERFRVVIEAEGRERFPRLAAPTPVRPDERRKNKVNPGLST